MTAATYYRSTTTDVYSAEFTISNDPELVLAILNETRDHLDKLGWGADSCRLCVALEEALNNALYHGNLELDSKLREGARAEFRRLFFERSTMMPYQGRRIYGTFRLSKETVEFVVRDDGDGFDPSTLADPTVEENLDKPSGRGVLLIRAFCDDVSHNDKGNEIRMSKTQSNGQP